MGWQPQRKKQGTTAHPKGTLAHQWAWVGTALPHAYCLSQGQVPSRAF